MNWAQRREIAHKAYKPSNNKFAVDVTRLRNELFHGQKIPLAHRAWYLTPVFNTRGELIATMNVEVRASASVGAMKTRGGRGHRMFIQCPACGGEHPNMIPVGRLHQHYGYQHEGA